MELLLGQELLAGLGFVRSVFLLGDYSLLAAN
jgi:hypothetical protein